MFFPQDSLEHCNYVRHHGVLQFIATFRRLRHLENDRLFYGDEIEYSLLKVELPTFFFLPLSLAVIVQRPCRTEGPVAWVDDVPDFTMQDWSRFIRKDPPFARCSSPHFAVSCLAATVRRQSPTCDMQAEPSGGEEWQEASPCLAVSFSGLLPPNKPWNSIPQRKYQKQIPTTNNWFQVGVGVCPSTAFSHIGWADFRVSS